MDAHEEAGSPMDLVRQRIAAVFGSWTRDTSLATMRAQFDALLTNTLDAAIENLSIRGMNADIVHRPGGEDSTLLYFHGGGYQIGSTRSHRELMIRLSHAGDCNVVTFDYRLAPEHRFPAAVEDGLSAYRWLLERVGTARSIAFAGDSAGGGLAVATMLMARDNGLPLPQTVVLLSPWLDMEASGQTYVSRAAVDPLTQRDKVLAMARTYLGRSGDPRHPLASPIHADLAGLPPVLIHAGDHEALLDDSRLFAQRLKEAGVPVELAVWDRMIHHFQLFPELAEARQSIEQIGAYLRTCWD
jgi:epsilon-lactone hydrolase